MKIRFYSIQDLYEEVKDFQRKVVRMQFLEKTYSSVFRGGEKTFHQLMTENILTLSVLLRPPRPGMDKGTLYYYSQPFHKCLQMDYKVKAVRDVADEIAKEREVKIRETFKDWTIRKGIYEIE